MKSLASQSSNSGWLALALQPEVLARFHNSLAEDLLPESVHHHARRKRMVGFGKPLCQAEPVLRRILRPCSQQRFRHTGLDILAGRIIGASL